MGEWLEAWTEKNGAPSVETRAPFNGACRLMRWRLSEALAGVDECGDRDREEDQERIDDYKCHDGGSAEVGVSEVRFYIIMSCAKPGRILVSV